MQRVSCATYECLESDSSAGTTSTHDNQITVTSLQHAKQLLLMQHLH